MGQLVSAIGKAFAQFFSPRMLLVVVFSAAVSLGLFVILFAVLINLLGLISWADISLFGFPLGAASLALGLLSGAAVLALVAVVGVFFFPPIAAAVASLFSDYIARLVEERHYPHLPPPRAQPISESIIAGLRILLLVIGLNLLFLPVYLFAIWLFGLGALLYLGLNGWILGKEYYQQAALRRLTDPEQKEIYRYNKGIVWLHGIIFTFLAGLPFMGLIVPVVATASMTHLVTGLIGGHAPTPDPARPEEPKSLTLNKDQA